MHGLNASAARSVQHGLDGVPQGNAADRCDRGPAWVRSWPGGDMVLNAESVVAKPESEPYAWGVRLTLRQFW